MKIRFNIKGEFEAENVETAKSIIDTIWLRNCPHEFVSIFEYKDEFPYIEKCIVITAAGTRCKNDKLIGDYCGIHINLNSKKNKII